MTESIAKAQVRPVYPTDLVASISTALSRVLMRGDRAWRQNRQLQVMMRQDPDIQHAIEVREQAGVSMKWRIKPVDEDDLAHKAKCMATEKAIRAIPEFVQMRRRTQQCIWYGATATALNWAMLPRPIEATAENENIGDDGKAESETASITIAPTRADPVPPDGIRWTADGRLVILSNPRSDRFNGYERVYTDGGSGVVVPDDERSAWLVAVWNKDAPNAADPHTADRSYAGHGLRSMLWDGWVRKQQLLQVGDSYAERLSRGTIMVGHDGTSQSEAAAKAVVDALGQAHAVTINTNAAEAVGGLDKMIQVFEASGTGNQIFRDMARDAGEQLKLCILGQTLTTDTAPTGLGSGVAEAHQDTFSKQLEYDTAVVDEAMTRDLVGPMWRANFPDDPRIPEFLSQNREDEEDTDKRIETAERLHAMGVPLALKDLYAESGFREPQGDEATVGGGGDPMGGVGDLLGSLQDEGVV